MDNTKCLEKHVCIQGKQEERYKYRCMYLIPYDSKQLNIIMITFKYYMFLKIYPLILLMDSLEMWIFISTRERKTKCIHLNRVTYVCASREFFKKKSCLA